MSDLGVEYFVIDTGWFGKSDNWEISRGEWVESELRAFCGRMKDIADCVRKNGMKFGFWLEIETADPKLDAVKNHPEFFVEYNDMVFLDLSNEEASQYI